MSASSPTFGQRTTSLGGTTASKPDEQPVQRIFRPTVTQEEFMHDTSDQILLSGTFGAGKSLIGCQKGHMLNTRFPGNRGLIVRKAFADVRSSTIKQTLLEEVIPESHIVEHNKGEHVIEHLTGQTDRAGDPVTAEIHYHGLDSGRKTGSDDLPRKIGSMEFGWIFVDEGTELGLGEWNQLLGRLRFNGRRQSGQWFTVPTQQIFTATNPAGPSHWMYELFYTDKGDGETEVYEMKLTENPGVDEAYVNRLRNNLSGIYKERYFEGKWVGSEGQIYGEYDPTLHLLHPDDLPGDWTVNRESEFSATGERCYFVDPPASWRVYRAVDFGYTNPFVCFDDQTEILTEDGWVEFPDLKRDVDVATVDPDTRQMEFQTPTSYIDQRYAGEMIRGSSKEAGANFKVTPNHQMVLESRKTGEWKKRRADDLPNWDHSIPVGGWTPSEGEPDAEFTVPHIDDGDRSKELPPTTRGAFARFLGLWLADGDVKRAHVRIAQKNGCDAVRSVLKRLGWEWSESSNGEGTVQFDISSIDLWRFFRDHDLLHKSREKRIPKFAFDKWDGDTLRRLLEGLMLGDGSQDDDNDPRGSYHTMSRQLADDVQRLAARLGIPSKVLDRDPGGGYGGSTGRLYQVSFHVHERATLSKMDIETVDYDGTVHCVEVPNGTLVVRRNDRPMVCGNCQWWARSPDDTLILFREIYKSQTRYGEHAKDIQRLTSDDWRLVKSFADHDAEGRETLNREGVNTVNADKNVGDGIQAVKKRLAPDDRGRADLYFMEGARVHKPDPELVLDNTTNVYKTVDEIPGYAWDSDDDEDEPVKEDDHGMDSLRYITYSLDGGIDIDEDELNRWKTVTEGL